MQQVNSYTSYLANYELATTLNYYRQSGGAMGTTFCNIHIYNPEKLDYKLKKGYSKYSFTDKWETILEDESQFDLKAMTKMAKSISKETSQPVLSISYFDDDAFELTLYIEGSRKAYYEICDHGIFKKNIPVLIKAMELDDNTAKALRYMTSVDKSAPEAIDRFSALLQLPLYLDKVMLDYSEGKVVIPAQEEAIKELAAEKKAEKSALGKKEDAILIQEIEGVPYFYVDLLNGIMYVIKPDGEGKVKPGTYYCYQLGKEGSEPAFIYDHGISFDLDAMSDMDNKVGVTYLQANQFSDERLFILDQYDVIDDIATGSEQCAPYREKILISEDKKIRPDHIIYSVGDVLRVPTERGLAAFGVRDTNYITTESNYYKKIFDKTVMHPNHYDITSAGVLYFDHTSQCYAEDGTIVKVGEYTEYEKGGNRKKNVRVDFLDYDQKLLHTEFVPVDFDFYRVFGSYCYIKEKRQIVMGGYCIDIDKKKVTPIETLNQKLKEKSSSSIRVKGENGEDHIAVIASKQIFILDMNLKPVRYTKLSDQIMGFWTDDKGHIYLITSKNAWKYPFKYADDSRIRIYNVRI